LTSQTKGDHFLIWSVSSVPLAPAKEEAIVDIVAFCYEEGKGGENFERKKVYIESEKG